ncbi:MAG: lysylphosphatidylglycerol synthase domain-containing protein [Planctomycetota bacterium]|jgi:uncharacterized membrane protein YbhN (UPF0104 family)
MNEGEKSRDNTNSEEHVLSAGGESAKPRFILLRICKIVVFLVVLFFVGWALIGRLAALQWDEVDFFFPLLGAAFLCGLLGRSISVLSYRALLRTYSRPPDWVSVMAIAWVSQIGKYVPGKIASIAGAVWLLRRYDVPGFPATSAVLLLHGLVVLVGLIISVPLTLWEPIRQILPAAWMWCSLLLVVGMFCLHPRIFAAAGNFLLRRFRYPELKRIPALRNYAIPVGVGIVQYLLIGVALWCVSNSVTEVSFAYLPLFVSAAALARSIGFLALFAPAGLGVREGILLIILGAIISPGTAAVTVVAIRLVLTIAEVLLAIIGAMILRVRKPNSSREELLA